MKETQNWIICDSCGKRELVKPEDSDPPSDWYEYVLSGHPQTPGGTSIFYVKENGQVCSLKCLKKEIDKHIQHFKELSSDC